MHSTAQPAQPPLPGQRLAGLDHLRALAIALVMVFHCGLFGHPQWVGSVGAFGWSGVDLFFVLSGYLIGGQLLGRLAAGRPLALREFYFKRLFRILPAYLAVLLLYFTIPAFKERGQLPPLWRFLTFTQNFGLDLRSGSAFSNAWSLCVEEQFYLLLPPLVLALAVLKPGRWALWLVPLLFGLGLFLRTLSWELFVEPLARAGDSGLWQPYFMWIYYPSYTRMDGLLMGVCLAAVQQLRPGLWARLTRYGNAWLLLALGLLAAAWVLCADLVDFYAAVFGFPLIAFAYGLLVLSALSPSGVLGRFHSRFSAFLAAVSYSLYLVHKPLIHLSQVLLGRLGYAIDSNAAFLCGLLAALLGGWLLHRLVERPGLRLRERLLRGRPGAAPSAAIAG